MTQGLVRPRVLFPPGTSPEDFCVDPVCSDDDSTVVDSEEPLLAHSPTRICWDCGGKNMNSWCYSISLEERKTIGAKPVKNHGAMELHIQQAQWQVVGGPKVSYCWFLICSAGTSMMQGSAYPRCSFFKHSAYNGLVPKAGIILDFKHHSNSGLRSFAVSFVETRIEETSIIRDLFKKTR